MSARDLEERRTRLVALSGAQRVQLQADWHRVAGAARHAARRPLRVLRVPAALGLFAAALVWLLYRRRSVAAVALPAVAASRWRRAAALVMRLWRAGLLTRLWPVARLLVTLGRR